MKVSIIGNSLTGLTLAKALANQGVRVDIFFEKKVKKISKIQTIGISKSNVEYFNKKILNISKLLWDISKIEIYSENYSKEKILGFENNNKKLFSLIRNNDLFKILYLNLKKSKFVNFKSKIDYDDLIKNKNNLIFNCDSNNLISKKFFYKKISKDYKSKAYVTLIKHKKKSNNHIASQIFTNKGPLAFLPLSSNETSVVFSLRGKDVINLNKLIKNYNTKYEITNISECLIFKLKSSNLRTYYNKNIIAFGDSLHRLHPLAGQGFNMVIRDVKEIIRLIEFRINHGLDLDKSICIDFEKKTKNRNYLFSSGIDLIYELFNFERKIKSQVLAKSIKILGNKKIINNFLRKSADVGIEF